MQTLLIVNQPKKWPLKIPGVRVVDARSYLTQPEFSGGRGTIVFNLCRSYRYQSLGYYVSLLAAARGHRPLPTLKSILDMKSMTIVRYASEDLDELIQRSLHPLQSDRFTLSVYFGTNLAKRYDRLSRQLFRLFDAPLLRAEFVRESKWRLQRLEPIGANEIPEEHWDFVIRAAEDFFSRPRYTAPPKQAARYSIAILADPAEVMAPSNERALRRFERAAARLGLEPTLIDRDDYGRLAEFDALFIRETTNVNHHTFRFSRRAQAEELVVIDDPISILRCSNKVYLAELLTRQRVPIPETVIVHRDNVDELPNLIGLPCILKQPDSSFSQGVYKVDSADRLVSESERLLEKSDLIIAQEFVPTEFDWRVGILDKKPLYVCRYYMAPRHWQIQKTEASGRVRFGDSDTLAVEDAPAQVINTALRAANLIGDGLYGVDLKEFDGRCVVIEVNDNPSIDAGIEDKVLKDALYDRVMTVFLNRIEALRRGSPRT